MPHTERTSHSASAHTDPLRHDEHHGDAGGARAAADGQDDDPDRRETLGETDLDERAHAVATAAAKDGSGQHGECLQGHRQREHQVGARVCDAVARQGDHQHRDGR